ncbi:MAG TPA: DNA-formamidopyrimidine glycosylase, partial [Psychrobacter sp.]|nr:DNA-formamidopyrimidine glycosylase [Psychrobacter sp.]
MPELPEVETTKTSLAPLLGQQVIDIKVFQPKLRWAMPDDLSSLADYTLDSV